MTKTAALILILILTASSTATFLPVKAQGKTITVPDDYPTINSAIGNASEGDTVFVRNGTYTEQTLTIGKTLTLTGENAQNTVIVFKPTLSWVGYYYMYASFGANNFGVNANNVEISGFTITSDLTIPDDQKKYLMDPADYTITGGRLILSGNQTKIDGNIFNILLQVSGFNQTVSENTIKQGIWCDGYSNVISENNVTGAGIIVGAASNIIYGNIITNSSNGLRLNYAEDNKVFNNTMTNCEHALTLMESSSNNVYANNITNNKSGLELFGVDSNNTLFENNVSNNRYGISVYTRLNNESNSIYLNSFVNNSVQVDTASTLSSFYAFKLYADTDVPLYPTGNFDDGKKGNYWSDYNGTDVNKDGIGDTPYLIDDVRSDNYPLMAPFYRVFSSSNSYSNNYWFFYRK